MENSVENVQNRIKPMRGVHKSTLDDKGRMYIPAKFRDCLSGGFVIARHVDKDSKVVCLKIYTEQAWERFYEKLKDIPQAERSKVIRSIDIQDVEPDKQGRFLVPATLRNYARLKGELAVVGGEDTAEVWCKELFDENVTDNMESTADIFEKYGL